MFLSVVRPTVLGMTLLGITLPEHLLRLARRLRGAQRVPPWEACWDGRPGCFCRMSRATWRERL
jgi:hypothetical protein